MLITKENLPKKAGVVNLNFVSSEEILHQTRNRETLVLREGQDIYLPHDLGTRFYPLLKGEQFLATVHAGSGHSRRLFFGGTDENPFLTELDPDLIEAYLDDGEETFFQALKPSNVVSWEQGSNKRALRQGDFFAFSNGKTWDWKNLFRSQLGEGRSLRITEEKNISMRGTRHVFTGLVGVLESKDHSTRLILGQGVLEAPDHEPVTFKFPHIIEQAKRLRFPQEAD